MKYGSMASEERLNQSLLRTGRHPTTVQLKYINALVLAAGMLLASCGTRETSDQRHTDANTPAGKVGQAAHKVAVEADKAGRVAERKLSQAAHDAKAGWQEDAHKDKDRDTR